MRLALIAALVLGSFACSSSSSSPAASSDPCRGIDTPPGCEPCWDTPAGACAWDGGQPAPARVCCYSFAGDASANRCASTQGKTPANVCN